jgi:transposase InsO family protein
MRFCFIRDQQGQHRVQTMCRVLKVSRSGFYDWRNRGCSARAEANQQLLTRIQHVHRQSRENYGAFKTWKRLRGEGLTCGRHRVARLRRMHGIEAKRMRRFRSGYAARQAEVPPAGNLLERNFTAHAPNQIWVGDATFIPTREGWLILAVLIDLYSRQVVGWSMGKQLNRHLVTDALMMAITHRRPAAGLIHHTDQGVVYGTASYRQIQKQHGIIPSMSRKANCLDNAVAESYFSNLKNELTWHCNFKDRDEARAAIFDYIELFYNRERLHETIGYLSPMEYERKSGS